MNEDLILTLQNYGFSEKEAKIYLTALSLGAAPASSIARNTNESRTTVYSILGDLVKKGYCSTVIRENVTYFSAVDPEMIVKQYEQKYKVLKEKLPEFSSIINVGGYKPQMLVFEGVDGIKKVYEDTLKYPDSTIKSFYGHSKSIQKMKEKKIALGDWLDYDYLPRRFENRISAKVLMSGDINIDKQYISLIEDGPNSKYTQYKYLKEQTKFTSEINLYGDYKIAVSVISDEELLGIIIKSKELYNTLDSLFTLLRKNVY